MCDPFLQNIFCVEPLSKSKMLIKEVLVVTRSAEKRMNEELTTHVPVNKGESQQWRNLRNTLTQKHRISIKLTIVIDSTMNMHLHSLGGKKIKIPEMTY